MQHGDVGYMQRTRDYYRAQGYSKDYRWAHNTQTPFAPLPKPLAQCRIALITTAMPDTEQGRSERRVYAQPSSPIPKSMHTAELSWHKEATHTDDVASFLPLEQLEQLRNEGVIGDIAPRFYCLPTEYSQRNTLANDAPAIEALAREDGTDIALLVPL